MRPTIRQIPSAESLLAGLQTAAREVPPEARRFHELHGRLVSRLESLAGRRFPWPRRDDTQGLFEEVKALEAAVPWISKLFARAAMVRTEVLRLKARAEEEAPEEAAWIDEKCTGWEADLERIGATLPQPAAISRAKKSVDDLADVVALHDDVLEWLLRARRVLARLETHDMALEGASLAAELPDHAASLRSEPSRSVIDPLVDRVRALEELVDKVPKEAPLEYADADKVLALVEDWHRHLRTLGQLPEEAPGELGDMRERLDVARRSWRKAGAETAEETLGETRALAERTRETARSFRDRALEELREQIRHLRQIAEAGPDLSEGVKSLAGRNVESGGAHLAWWRDLETVRESFRADAENARDELADRRRVRLEELAKEIETLEGRPRGEAQRARLFQIRTDLQELGHVDEPIHVLSELRRIDRLSDALREVAAQIDAAGRALRERAESLRERDRALRRAARRAGIRAPRVSPGVGSLERSDTAPDRKEADDEVTAVESALAEAEADLVRRCADTLRDLAEHRQRLAGVLDAAGIEIDHGPLPSGLDESASPDRVAQVAEVVEAARARNEELDRAADEVREALEERRTGFLARLDGIDPDSLGPGDREDVRELREDLEALDDPPEADDPIDRIETLLSVLATGDELLGRFARDEQETRRLRSTLSRRFRALRTDNLLDGDGGGALAERVEALIRGVPERPVSWPGALHQLHRAQVLLDRLESHLRRQIAGRLAEEVTLLDRWRHRSAGDETGRLLDELDALDPYELPSASLRRRIHRRARAHRDAERRDHG